MEETTLFFLSVCVIIVTHLWLPAIHDREEEKGTRDDEERGRGEEGGGGGLEWGEMSLGAAGVLVSEKREEDKEERKNKRAC